MYEYLIEQSEISTFLARQYHEAGDENMATFWANAAEGFKQKARNLTLGEADEQN